jgi:hypothetical protein
MGLNFSAMEKVQERQSRQCVNRGVGPLAVTFYPRTGTANGIR